MTNHCCFVCSDGSVVQFQYGEDAIDVTKSAYLDRFNFLAGKNVIMTSS